MLFAGPALADPWDDAGGAQAQARARAEGRDVLLGAGWDASRGEAPPAGWSGEVAPTATLSVGELTPINLGGDEEPGGVSARVGFEGAVRWRVLRIRLSPQARLDDLAPSAALTDAWLGADAGWWRVGFGQEQRWTGPSRHGAVVLSNNATAPWMGGGRVQGRLPGWFDRLGRLSWETEVGWLQEPRGDVAEPGLMFMEFRWLPHPIFELGVDRLSIFGGEGRPDVDIGQLLVPTEPHVYDDAEKSRPDQDELAAVDFRVSLPLAKWWGGPVRWVEGWWVYGGEDLVERKLGPVPYPALAGVGNQYGAEVALGPVIVNAEYTRLMDDGFRWYVGHRVYHDGFTQDERVMGAFGGPDSETWFGSVAIESGAWRARLWGDHARLVAVVEQQGDHTFALGTEDRRFRLAVDGGLARWGGRWTGGVAWEHGEGVDFVPGASADSVRVYVRAEPGAWSSPSVRPGSP